MKRWTLRAHVVIVVALIALVTPAQAQPQWSPPNDIAYRKATVLSEGIALAAHVFQSREKAGKRLPTIILCHGWGGEARHLRREAVAFADAGYTAITFDYRGWGDSHGRLIAKSPQAPRLDGQPFNAEVVELRDVIHPWERIQDIVSVLSWAVAEPEVDANKLGLWGTSYGGGHVLFVAAYDARIKAIVSQVGSFDGRRTGKPLDNWRAIATRRAHGEIPYPAASARVPGRLYGFPVLEHMLTYAPVEQAHLIRADQAMLIIVAEKEELFDNREHGQRVYDRLGGPKQYTVIPGITHYDVYGKSFDQTMKLAKDWYDKHLK